MNRTLAVLACLLLPSLCPAQQPAQSEPSSKSATASSQVPVIDGGAGTCFMELTIHDLDAKPVYAAKVKVHIDYGFGGFHKLDLEAATNADGKVKFTGLPARVRRPPLAFHISKDKLEGLATADPATECEAKRGITIAPRKDEENP
jgi:hypothetical protein